jgi:hypothetical protein
MASAFPGAIAIAAGEVAVAQPGLRADPDFVSVRHNSFLSGSQRDFPAEAGSWVIALNSLSKLHGLPQVGLRLGFAAENFADGEMDLLRFVILHLEFSFDGDEIVVVAATMIELLLSRHFALFVAGTDVRGDGDAQS